MNKKDNTNNIIVGIEIKSFYSNYLIYKKIEDLRDLESFENKKNFPFHIDLFW